MKHWSVLIVGLVLGLAVGLVYTWGIAPLEFYDTYPPLLRKDFRDDWTRLTVLAYGAEGNWSRTQLRLQDIPQAEIQDIAEETLDQAVKAGRPLDVLQKLARLATSYGVDSMAVNIYTGSNPVAPTPVPSALPATLTPTPTQTMLPPTPTPSPVPTYSRFSTTPTPFPSAAYHIISQTLTCVDSPLLSVSLVVSRTTTVRRREVVEDVPVPGREVWLLWEDGADRATTGFKPEFDPGYADFVVGPGHVYKLYIDIPQGVPVTTVQVEPCTPAEGRGWISRWLVIHLEDND